MPRSSPSRAHGASSKGGKPHAIRIIGGDWKRTPLPVLDLDGLRPTPDRVRETLFNWLGQRLDGQRCLDLFAGSGALGFEAASRGAARVVDGGAQCAGRRPVAREPGAPRARYDRNRRSRRLAPRGEPRARIVRRGVPRSAVRRRSARHGAANWPCRCVSPEGFLYVEAGDALELDGHETLAGWEIVRQGKAGAVHFHLLQRENEE